MNRIFLILTSSIYISIAHVNETGAALFDDEYAFRCAAIYAILEKAYSEPGDEEEHNSYAAKFQKLESEIEKLYEHSESGRARAYDEIQKYVNEIVAITSLDSTLVPGMVETCDSGLETFPGL